MQQAFLMQVALDVQGLGLRSSHGIGFRDWIQQDLELRVPAGLGKNGLGFRV